MIWYALYVLMGVIAIEGYLDYDSTQAFRKNGSGYEANPVMAWFQSWLGQSWWVVKVVLVPVMLGGAYFVATYNVRLAVILLFLLALPYAIVIMSNYRLAREG